MRRPQGFTLLEVVMVLVILGILRALGLPPYFSAGRNAYFAEAAERLQEIREFAGAPAPRQQGWW